MRRFAALCEALDTCRDEAGQHALISRYLSAAPAADAAWGVQLLAGGRPRPVASRALLRRVACEAAGIADWLFDACLQASGDWAETIAHVLPDPAPVPAGAHGLAEVMADLLPPLRAHGDAERARRLQALLAGMPAAERQVFLRLAGGGFKSALARRVLQRALAAHAGLAPALMAQRLTVWGGPRAPVTAEGCRRLLAPAGEVESDGDGHGGPRRFEPFETLPADAPLPQPAQDAQPAWAYGGLRAQIVRRGEDCRIWSAEHELLTGRLPEIAAAAQALPAGTVLDGEVLLWPEDATRPAPPALLHRRLASKTPVRPAVFIVRDVLDRDDLTAAQRRAWLAPWLTRPLRLLPWLDGDAGSAPREHARAHGAQGVLLLPRTGVAPIRFWPAPPLTLRGVPIYAEADAYTLAVWSRPPRDADEARAVAAAIAERRPPAPGAPRLLPLTRAASALPADDAAQLAQVARETTVQRFGPVRSLLPTVVVELGFADLHRSARHKSGFVLQAPRLLRLRGDLRWDQADSVARLQALSPDAGDEGEIVNRL